jgi:hypothetical protein
VNNELGRRGGVEDVRGSGRGLNLGNVMEFIMRD